MLSDRRGMRDLGGQYSDARDINNLGQVVGQATLSNEIDSRRGFLYTEGKILDINALIDSALGWTVATAIGINDSRQILGYACHTLELCRPVRLDPISPPPVPEPRGFAMVLTGLAASGLWRSLRARNSRSLRGRH